MPATHRSGGGWFAYSHGLTCPECGADAAGEMLQPRAQQFKAWFIDGDRGRRTESSCENGHSWASRVSSNLYLGRPRRLWNALAFNRTVIPTPSSYVVALGAGAVVATAARHLGLKRWQLLPPAFVVASWASTTATAFRGPRRASTVLALRDQIDPRGARQRHDDITRQMLETCPFPAYALATDQPQPTQLGGTSYGDDRVLRSVSVFHGDPTSLSGTLVEVETTTEPIAHTLWDETERLRRDSLVADHIDPVDGRLDPRWGRLVRRESELLPHPDWVASHITVDGRDVASQRANIGDHHCELAELGPCTVVIRSRHTDPSGLRLARTDLNTYDLR